MSPDIPIPPDTINDPFVLLVDALVATIDTISEKVGEDNTEKAFPEIDKLVPAVYTGICATVANCAPLA